MAKVSKIESFMVDLKPKAVRTDAIQTFVSQETPIVRITDSEGEVGTGYSYTIGTGGASVMSLLNETLLPQLMDSDADRIEQIWHELFFKTHATTVGPITSLAFAAADTALWDLKCRKAGLPLWKMAGGMKRSVPLYTTEGGWLQLPAESLAKDAAEAKARGLQGAKIKIGKLSEAEDRARVKLVREAVGPEFEIMTDANQAFSLPIAIRRSRMLAEFGVAWLEEPMAADDVGGHAELARSSQVPIAVGESMYSASQFKDYLQAGACSVVQVDAARIGGITPWLKVASMAQAFNVPVCPHFLMELHVSLACAVPNAPLVEYIPQLDDITLSVLEVRDGCAVPPDSPGIGIDWDWATIQSSTDKRFTATFGGD